MSVLSSSTLQKRLNIMSLYSKYIIKEETTPALLETDYQQYALPLDDDEDVKKPNIPL